jgi:hypothetical protein
MEMTTTRVTVLPMTTTITMVTPAAPVTMEMTTTRVTVPPMTTTTTMVTPAAPMEMNTTKVTVQVMATTTTMGIVPAPMAMTITMVTVQALIMIISIRYEQFIKNTQQYLTCFVLSAVYTCDKFLSFQIFLPIISIFVYTHLHANVKYNGVIFDILLL